MRGRRSTSLLLDVVTVVLMFLLLVPVLWVFLASIKPDTGHHGRQSLADQDHLRALRRRLRKEAFLIALNNSLIVGLSSRPSPPRSPRRPPIR